MTLLRSTLMLCVALPLLSACPDDPDTSASSIPLESLEQEVVALQCHRLFQCGQNPGSIGVFLPTQADCLANFGDALREELFSAEKKAIAKGTVIYSPTAAARCAASKSCGSQAPIECRDVFTGTVAEGETCELDIECVPGTYCNSSATDCPGTCVAQVTLGAACTEDGQCPVPADGFGACFSGVCIEYREAAELAVEGAACGAIGESPIFVETRCGAGLSCKVSADNEGVCVSDAAIGESCSEKRCAAGLCQPTQDDATNLVCTVIALEKQAGGKCGRMHETYCDAFGGLACSDPEDGVCEALGDGTVDAACANEANLDTFCNDGLYCGDEGTCVELKALGETCNGSSQCLSGYCDWTSDVCAEDTTNACGF